MQGCQLTFYTQQDRRHRSRPLAEWLLDEARRLGVGGGTLQAAAAGFGHHGKLHSARFFELADQPVQVTLALSDADAERLFARLHDEGIDVFYVRVPIEFGMSSAR